MIAVIGMNYGDEGKGHITDYFSELHTLNVRFNGGAQAAHAVFHSDGRNHIFHHFGSGSLSGARTLLSHHFIVNPIIFAQELEVLAPQIPKNKFFVDPRCIVTTPFDMLINSFASTYLKKNDTCGMGINETIERSRFKQLCINVRQLFDYTEDKLLSILEKINNEYVPWRLEQLGLPQDEFKKYFSKPVPMTAYLNVIRFMLNHVYMWHDSDLIDKFIAKKRQIVFEGAQGLRLDQNRIADMPFLTRSNTGIKNVLSIIRSMKSHVDLQTVLVSRTYITRHGDGPLKNECAMNVDEVSNPENQYQGKMRYAPFDISYLEEAVDETIKTFDKHVPDNLGDFKIGLALNCLDQIKLDLDQFTNRLKYISKGPTKNDISIF